MTHKTVRQAKGFTLMELLIVIGIIAILTVAFLPTLRGGQAKARDVAKKTLVENVTSALESMINDGIQLPADTGLGAHFCITDYTQDPGKAIATAITRTPQAFPVPAQPGNDDLCSRGYLFYKNLGATSYILAFQVETPENANVEAAANPAAIEALATFSDALALTDQPVAGGNNGSYYYMVAK